LFDGKALTGWKLPRPDGHPSWTVKDGILKQRNQLSDVVVAGSSRPAKNQAS
jgi:hypothetical protein